MAKSVNQKLKLLYILDFLKQHSDEEHGVTMPDIIQYLARNDISGERKSIYSDMELLRLFGYDIIGQQEKGTFLYKLVSKDFELAEVKLLVDAVQSSKCITVRKSNELIKKLERLVSLYEAKSLQRQVYVSGRIKAMNESVYYNVDELQNAMNTNVQVKFQYYEWATDKSLHLRRNGEFYVVSPWALIQDDENYYLLAYDEKNAIMKHFRVDKLTKIVLLKCARLGKEQMEHIDLAGYTKRIFGMYGGETTKVRLRCRNSLIGVIIDRFGKEVPIRKAQDGYFDAVVDVVTSQQFYAWIIALGEGITLVSPDSAVRAMKEEIRRLVAQYEV